MQRIPLKHFTIKLQRRTYIVVAIVVSTLKYCESTINIERNTCTKLKSSIVKSRLLAPIISSRTKTGSVLSISTQDAYSRTHKYYFLRYRGRKRNSTYGNDQTVLFFTSSTFFTISTPEAYSLAGESRQGITSSCRHTSTMIAISDIIIYLLLENNPLRY